MSDVNKLFVFKSLLTRPSNVLPLHPKQTFPPTIWIFTDSEGDEIKTRLPFQIFSTLPGDCWIASSLKFDIKQILWFCLMTFFIRLNMLLLFKSLLFPTMTGFLISNIFKSDKYWQSTWTAIKTPKINIPFQYILLAIVCTIKYCHHVHVNLCSVELHILVVEFSGEGYKINIPKGNYCTLWTDVESSH